MSPDVPALSDDPMLGAARADGAKRDERLRRIWTWLCRIGVAVRSRLYWAFPTVLLRLSDVDFERFMDADPVALDLHGTLGMVIDIVRPDLPCRVPAIFINVGAQDLQDASYEGVVGHEIAHLVLGHLESRRSRAEEHEEVAKKLAEWGLSDRLVAAPGGGEYLLLQTLKDNVNTALGELTGGLEEASFDDLSDALEECLHIVDGLLRRQQAARVCARSVSDGEAHS